MSSRSEPDTLKAEIIQMLEFPRSLMRSRIDLDQCTHGGNFAERDRRCQNCPEGLECEWLYHNDELSGLRQKPLTSAASALAFAVEYVDAEVARIGHTRRVCRCDSCAWLRGASRLEEKVSKATSDSAA